MLFTCRETVARLDAYGANALSAREQTGVRAHLNHCPTCRAESAKAARVTRAVSHAMTVVPPIGYLESLPARLVARQGDTSVSHGVWWRHSRVAAVAAAALLVILLGRSAWQQPTDMRLDPRVLAPTAVSDGGPTAVTGPQDLTPRTSASAEKREDLIEIQLVAVAPRTVTAAEVALTPMVTRESKGPMLESWRIDQLITAILRPRREAARSTAEGIGGDLYPTGEEAVALARQATYDARTGGLGGLTAFVSGSVSAIADVTLPLY